MKKTLLQLTLLICTISPAFSQGDLFVNKLHEVNYTTESILIHQGDLLFTNRTPSGTELYSIDSSGNENQILWDEGVRFQYPEDLASIDSCIYFSAVPNDVNPFVNTDGFEPYCYCGDTTKRIANINTYAGTNSTQNGSFPKDWIKYKDKIYFTANTDISNTNRKLFVIEDDTVISVIENDLSLHQNFRLSSTIYRIDKYQDKLLLLVRGYNIKGINTTYLMTYDGTSFKTIIDSVYGHSSNNLTFAVKGDTIFGVQEDINNPGGHSIFVYTPQSINWFEFGGDTLKLEPHNFSVVNEKVYFAGVHPVTGARYELWTINDTTNIEYQEYEFSKDQVVVSTLSTISQFGTDKIFRNKDILTRINSSNEIESILNKDFEELKMEGYAPVILFNEKLYFIAYLASNITEKALYEIGICHDLDCTNDIITSSANHISTYNYVYPNPTHGIIKASQSVNKMELMNIDGTKVSITESNIIDLSNFPAGLYLLKTFDDNGKISIERIIKK